MAEDNLTEIMKNWDTMDIGELGTSLLARKSKMDKASAKRAKRQDRLSKIMGGVMATQSIFAASANNNIKKLEKNKQFDQLVAKAQLGEINTIAGIYSELDKMSALANKDITIDNWEEVWKEASPELRSATAGKVKPLMINELTNMGAVSISKDEALQEQLAEDALKEVMGNLINNRSSFESSGIALDIAPEGASLFGTLSNMTLPEYQQSILRIRDKELDSLRKGGTNIADWEQWRNVLAKVGIGEGTKEGNVFTSYKSEPLPMTTVLKDINFTHNITTSLNELRKLPKYRISYWQKQAADPKNANIKTAIEDVLDRIDTLQDQGTVHTGIRSKRRGFRLRRSPLRVLQQELKEGDNSVIRDTMINKTQIIYQRLADRDPTGIAFNKAFFGGEYVDPAKDSNRLIGAATAFVLTSSVKDYRPISTAYGIPPKEEYEDRGFFRTPLKKEGISIDLRERKTGLFNIDVNNYIYDFSAVDSILENSFTVKDGQFIAEQGFKKKDPKDKLAAIKEEWDSIMSRTNLSEGDKKLLGEKLVVDLDARSFVDFGYEMAPGLTNAEIIDLFNTGLSVDEFLTGRRQIDIFKKDSRFSNIFEE